MHYSGMRGIPMHVDTLIAIPDCLHKNKYYYRAYFPLFLRSVHVQYILISDAITVTSRPRPPLYWLPSYNFLSYPYRLEKYNIKLIL